MTIKFTLNNFLLDQKLKPSFKLEVILSGGTLSETNLRLLAIDIAQRALKQNPTESDPNLLRTLHVAEKYALGHASAQEMEHARDTVWEPLSPSAVHEIIARTGARVISRSIRSISKGAIKLAKSNVPRIEKKIVAEREAQNQIDFIVKILTLQDP